MLHLLVGVRVVWRSRGAVYLSGLLRSARASPIRHHERVPCCPVLFLLFETTNCPNDPPADYIATQKRLRGHSVYYMGVRIKT